MPCGKRRRLHRNIESHGHYYTHFSIQWELRRGIPINKAIVYDLAETRSMMERARTRFKVQLACNDIVVDLPDGDSGAESHVSVTLDRRIRLGFLSPSTALPTCVGVRSFYDRRSRFRLDSPGRGRCFPRNFAGDRAIDFRV